MGCKMTDIYLVRHCEAMGNVKRLFQGTTDLDISELGATQLTFLTKRFENIPLDKVYSSPLIRTQKTAKAIIGSRNMEIITEEGLIELHGGIIEGKSVKETFGKMPELLDAWENHPQDFAPKDGESMRHAYDRIWKTVLKLVDENKNKTIALATHGGVIRCLNCRILHNDITKLKEIPVSDNTGITHIRFDNNLNPTIISMNNSRHLPDIYLNRKGKFSQYINGEFKF